MDKEIQTRIIAATWRGEQFELAARYRDAGDELIFFIHGLGCSKESFDDAFGCSRFAGYQLLSIDLVGYGRSARPQDFSYSMEDQAEILGSVLAKMKAKTIHIVAHSMGGTIGLILAEDIENRLGSFVNIEGNLIAEDCGLISRKTTTIPFEQFENGLFDKFRAKGHKQWREQSRTSDVLGFYRSCQSLVAWSDSGRLLEKFANLDTKKVYIYGGENSEMDILEKLGAIPTIPISGSGHFVMTDNPKEFYTRLFEIVADNNDEETEKGDA